MMITDARTVETDGQLRQFGFIMAGFIGVLFGFLIPWIWGLPLTVYPWLVVLAFLVPAVARPTVLRPVYRGWMWIGERLGWVNQRIILGILFFLIFTPTSLVLSVFGRDPMRRRVRETIESYRIASIQPDNSRLKAPY